jgi:multidrug efflux pump subunit AcrA (membrane-fusion protein)
MMQDPVTPQFAPAPPEPWQEIEGVVEVLGRLTRSASTAGEFYGQLIERAVTVLAAEGAAAWTLAENGNLALLSQLNLPILASPASSSDAAHQRLLRMVLESGEGRLIGPNSGTPGDGMMNPTPWLLILSPVLVDRQVAAVLEVFQRPNASPAAQRGFANFLATLADLAADFHRNYELKAFRSSDSFWRQFEAFLLRLHATLDPKAVAYVTANEGRTLIGCDRVSVARVSGQECTLLAVSGVDAPDPRANAIAGLKELILAVTKVDEPLWTASVSVGLPTQIEVPLQTYLDASPARFIGVLPLKSSTSETDDGQKPVTIGALVVEQFHSVEPENSWQQRTIIVSRHCAVALQGALTHSNLPLLPVWRALEKISWVAKARQLPKTLAVLAGLALAVVLLIFIPADLEIEARGELLPKQRVDVFAGTDGVVNELKVGHAEQVEKGQLLAVLRRPQLDFEFARVAGELQTARKKLAAVQASRLSANAPSGDTLERANQLTADEEELKELLRSLQEQQEVLQLQRADLQIRSPLQGEVLTWNVQQLLEARPVQRGQVLMSVADLKGPWELEMRIPDDQIGYVLESQRELGQKLEVRFVLATDPGVTYAGHIARVASLTEVAADDQGPSVLVSVDIDREKMPQLRPGASVIAKIQCGRRSLGYVWLHDLYRAIQSHIFF